MSQRRKFSMDEDGFMSIIPYCCICGRMEDETKLLRFQSRQKRLKAEVWFCYGCHVNREPEEVRNFMRVFELDS